DERNEALSILSQILDQKDVRSRARDYLSTLQPIALGENSSATVRELYKVVGAFAKSGDPDALEWLKKDAMQGRPESAQLYALKQIPSSDPDLPKILSDVRNSGSVSVQEEVLYRAGSLVMISKDQRPVDLLTSFLNPGTDVRLQDFALTKLEMLAPF